MRDDEGWTMRASLGDHASIDVLPHDRPFPLVSLTLASRGAMMTARLTLREVLELSAILREAAGSPGDDELPYQPSQAEIDAYYGATGDC